MRDLLYPKNQRKTLDIDLFKHPTNEYRGTPFWAWNTRLEKNELEWQIEQLKSMGFGGFHMHSRAGIVTPYLGEDFMALVRTCVEKAKKENMLAWLYDEDRWPSGFAGGLVTKDPAYRQKILRFTVNEEPNAAPTKEEGRDRALPFLLGCYDIVLNADGSLQSYDFCEKDAEVRGTKWYAYLLTVPCSDRFNGYTYVDTLMPEAMNEFIRVTYDAYYAAVGEDFGKCIPSIFTDEPQTFAKQTLPFAASKNRVNLPFTTDFPEKFAARYGYDLLPKLPELLWELPDGNVSEARYHYHDYVCELFTSAFSDACGAWCDAHGIALTGHLMQEPTLDSQTCSVGEAMRSYRGFGLPGIDMLCNGLEYTTAKQCQSAVHQFAREGMVSELYGVTGWDFDFRGHKFQGDWQACLGVTIRVPHLAWVSMKGSAKRDYPASIHYQSAWYKEYPVIEDHFARLNTALTRGTPAVRIAVVHPVESYWLRFGPSDATSADREMLERSFDNVVNTLLFGTLDFDFLSESLLPTQVKETSDASLAVGAMRYTAVIVPGCLTIRGTTLDILEALHARGGKVLFYGDVPKYVDARPSDRALKLAEKTAILPQTATALSDALKNERDIEIRNDNGRLTNNLLYQLRDDGDGRWLFIAHGKPAAGNMRYTPQRIRVSIYSLCTPVLYDTTDGSVKNIPFRYENGRTVMDFALYASDSLLLKLEKPSEAPTAAVQQDMTLIQSVDFREPVPFTLSEPNVMVLDMARVSWDNVTYGKTDEILRLDNDLRRGVGYTLADGSGKQPWCIEEEKVEKFPYVKFGFMSEIDVPAQLAFEEAVEIICNGETVDIRPDGYFTDKDIRTVRLPGVKKGYNEIIVRMPFGRRTGLENCFLLGHFGVRTAGASAVVTAMPEKLGFGDIVPQGLPFYGAAVTYRMDVDTPCGDMTVTAAWYSGALMTVKVDGKDAGRIAFAPFTCDCGHVEEGRHTVELTLYATRVNCHGGLHNCSASKWIGPGYWYSGGAEFAYEYQLKKVGVLSSPVIRVYREQK